MKSSKNNLQALAGGVKLPALQPLWSLGLGRDGVGRGGGERVVKAKAVERVFFGI